MLRKLSFASTVLLLATAAYCQDPPIPTPATINPHVGPVTVSLTAGAQVTLSDAAPKTTPTVYIEVDGPLSFSNSPFARVYGRIGLTSAPGENIDISDVSTFRAGEFAGGVYRILGYCDGQPTSQCSTGTQRITTSLACEGGLGQRLSDEARDKFINHYGCGLRFDEHTTRASFSFLYGRDAGISKTFDYGQLMAWGSLPLLKNPKGEGTLVLTGDGSVNLKHDANALLTGVIRLGIVVDLAAMFSK